MSATGQFSLALDNHILRRNYGEFLEQARVQIGSPVREIERVDAAGTRSLLDDALVRSVDTLIVVSFDSLRTGQRAEQSEVDAARWFLDQPGNVLVVSLHHDIGHASTTLASDDAAVNRRKREAEFRHHGDLTIPPEQGFSGFGRSLLAGLGMPVENRFGLRPALDDDGQPAPIDFSTVQRPSRFLDGVQRLNAHPHLPHLERLADTASRLAVVARQSIDLAAPPHPFTRGGRSNFDAMLQSRSGAFAGDLLVTDATVWSSTAGGLTDLRRLWRNLIGREPAGEA